MGKLTSYRYARKIYFALMAIGALFMIIALLFSAIAVSLTFITLGLVLIAVGFIWMIVYYKCPHCHGPLSFHEGLPDYCPSCGEKIGGE